MTEPVILDPNGNPVQSLKYQNCPDCGRTPDKRIPSAGFGQDIYWICPCGREFKELPCPKATL